MLMFQALVLFIVLNFHAAVGDPVVAREVHTDLMIDDIISMVPLSHAYRPSKGRGLLFVTCGGDTLEKARALHTLTYLLGIPEAQIVAGSAGPETPDVAYVGDYTKNNGREAFIRALAAFRGPTTFASRYFVNESTRFRKAYGKTSPLFLASAYSFGQTNIEVEYPHFTQFDGGAFWKYSAAAPFPAAALSAFNMNDSRQAAVTLIDFAQRHAIPFYSVSSDLVQTSPDLAAALREPQRSLWKNPAHGHIMKSLLEGMKGFRDELADILTRAHGLNAPFVTLWEPDEETWVQDLLTVMVTLNPELVTGWRTVDVKIADKLHQSGLGFAVQTTASPTSTFREATALHRDLIVKNAPVPFSNVEFTPDFTPAAAINHFDHTPIAFITKTSIDDVGALRSLLGLGNRLQLVIAESTHTPTLAAVLDKLIAGFNREKQVAVKTGVGDTDEKMAGIASLGVLERHLAATGLLAKNVLLPGEIANLRQLDASSFDASNDLIEFLERNVAVDLVVASSARTVTIALLRRPDLVAKIRTLHIMAGVRNPKLSEDNSGGWTDGEPTRNTEIDVNAAEQLVTLAQKAQVRTFYYSSHLSGGMLSPDNFRLSIPVWEGLRKKFAVEREIEQLRLNWNDGLIEKGKKLDRNTNFGPPLTWLMAAMVALGDNGTKYFSATPGKISFNNGKIDFVVDPSSSLQVMNVQDTYVYLDKLTAYLSQKAHTKPRGAVMTAVAELGNCSVDLLNSWLRRKK